MEELVGGGGPTFIHRFTKLELVKWSQPSACLANCCHLEIRRGKVPVTLPFTKPTEIKR